MARRFGGPHSPGAPGEAAPSMAAREAMAAGRRVDAAGARATLMWLPPAVAAVASLGGDGVGLALGLAGAGALALAAWLLRHGLRAQAAFEARAVARRPRLPRKLLAALCSGGGAALLVLSGAPGRPLDAALFGLAAGALHLGAFGLDPMADKRAEGVDAWEQDRVARVATEAEGALGAIREAVASLGDRALSTRAAGFEALARRLIRAVEEDPRGLAEARRFLVVYLMGARDATLRFVDLYRRTRDAGARADYEALLADLEANVAGRTRALLDGGREAMELEIGVLRDRLRREGVSPP